MSMEVFPGGLSPVDIRLHQEGGPIFKKPCSHHGWGEVHRGHRQVNGDGRTQLNKVCLSVPVCKVGFLPVSMWKREFPLLACELFLEVSLNFWLVLLPVLHKHMSMGPALRSPSTLPRMGSG